MQMQNFFTTEQISENISETPEGFLLCRNVPIARIGELLYTKAEVSGIQPGADGMIRITRDGDVLFSTETMDSFSGKAITVLHPTPENDTLYDVRPDNWKELACGTMQNIRQGEGDDADKLLADFLITDADAIAKVMGGLREVSCGYIASYEETSPGYGRQTQIIGNHVALVSRGRCGSECAIQDSVEDGAQNDKQVINEVTIMAGIKERLSKLFTDAKTVVDELPDTETVVNPTQDDAGGAAYAGIVADLQMQLQCIRQAMEEYQERVSALTVAIETLQAAQPTMETVIELKSESLQDAEIDSDTLSRAEIIAPGIAKTATIKRDSLDVLAKTTDGAAVIASLTNGKEIDESNLDVIFTAASEVVKASRSASIISMRDGIKPPDAPKVMTPELLQKQMDAHWSARKA